MADNADVAGAMERILTMEMLEVAAQVVDELRLIRQNLEALVAFQEWQAGAYREQRDGGLPNDFPAREALEAAGITAIEDVPRSAKQLRQIDGIGWDEATAIASALKQRKSAA